MMNPLDQVGREFQLSLMNPNPKAARNKDGPRYRVEFDVDAETFESFMAARELAGLVLECSAVVAATNEPIRASGAGGAEGAGTGTNSARPDESRAPGQNDRSLAYVLHSSGYFRNPKLWRALHRRGIYTLGEHKTFIEGLPCVAPMLIRGLFHPYGVNVDALRAGVMLELACMGDVCLHHASSASDEVGGRDQPDTPQKPMHFYGVPLCHEHHAGWVHTKHATHEEKEKLLELAVALTANRVKEAIKVYLGVESLSGITLAQLRAFEAEIGMPLTNWKGGD